MTPKTDEERGLRAALWAIALSGAALTLASPFVLGREGVLGVALGSVIAAFNLWSLGRIVRAFMNGAGLPWVLLAALKLVGLLAVVAVVLKLGLTCPPSQTNFLFVDLGDSELNLFAELQRRRLIVRRLGQFGATRNSYRISIGTPAENDQLIEALRDIMGSHSPTARPVSRQGSNS